MFSTHSPQNTYYPICGDFYREFHGCKAAGNNLILNKKPTTIILRVIQKGRFKAETWQQFFNVAVICVLYASGTYISVTFLD